MDIVVSQLTCVMCVMYNIGKTVFYCRKLVKSLHTDSGDS